MHKIRQVLLSAAVALGMVLLPMLSPLSALADTGSPAAGNGGHAAVPTTMQPIRIAGSDRYQTAAQIAEYGWKSTSEYAVLAVGSDGHLVDALAAAPLAKLKGAPILLTQADALNSYAAGELQRLKVKTVYLVTGLGVVSPSVLNSLKAMGIAVVPLGGSDRIATALNIAKILGTPSQVAVVTAWTNADAMSIAPVAAAQGMPILLTNQSTLPPNVLDYLTANRASIRKTYVVGGTGAVSDGVSGRLAHPVRLAGADRYGTNLAVLQQFAAALKPKFTFVANGADAHLVDALTGAPLAAMSNSLILLTNGVDFAHTTQEMSGLDLSPDVIGLGGTGSIPDSLLLAVEHTLPPAAAGPGPGSTGSQPPGGGTTTTPSGGGGGGGGGGSYTPPSTVSWQSGGSCAGPVSETADGTYGPSSGLFTVNGNMTLGGGSNSGINLQNVKITGTLTLNPGASGRVELNNVSAANVVVQSGASHSIDFIAVTVTGTLTVNAAGQTTTVHIVISMGTSIGSTVVESGASLENDNTGSAGGAAFGNISLNVAVAGATVQLAGPISSGITVAPTALDVTVEVLSGANITGTVTVTAQVTIWADSSAQVGNVVALASVSVNAAGGATVGNIQVAQAGIQSALSGAGTFAQVVVSPAAVGVQITLASGTQVTTVTVAVSVTLAGSGTVGTVTAAEGYSGITVTAQVTVTTVSTGIAVVHGGAAWTVTYEPDKLTGVFALNPAAIPAEAKYFGLFTASGDQIGTCQAVNSTVRTVRVAFGDPSQLVVKLYKDATGMEMIASGTLSGGGPAGTGQTSGSMTLTPVTGTWVLTPTYAQSLTSDLTVQVSGLADVTQYQVWANGQPISKMIGISGANSYLRALTAAFTDMTQLTVKLFDASGKQVSQATLGGTTNNGAGAGALNF